MSTEQEREEAIITNYFNFLIETENVKIPDVFFKKIKEFLLYKKTTITRSYTNSKIKDNDPYFFFDNDSYYSKYKNEEKYIVV